MTGPLKALPLPRRSEPDVWITVLYIADIPRAFGELNGIAVAVLREIGSVDVSEGFHRHVIAADPARRLGGRHLPPGIDLVIRFQPGPQHLTLKVTNHQIGSESYRARGPM